MSRGKELKQAWARFVSESVSLSKTFLARFEKITIFFSSFCDLMLNICSAISSSSEYSCARHSSTMHLNICFGEISIDSDYSKILTLRNQSNRMILPPILLSIDLFEKRMIPCDDRKEWQDQLEMFWTWTVASVLFQWSLIWLSHCTWEYHDRIGLSVRLLKLDLKNCYVIISKTYLPKIVRHTRLLILHWRLIRVFDIKWLFWKLSIT